MSQGFRLRSQPGYFSLYKQRKVTRAPKVHESSRCRSLGGQALALLFSAQAFMPSRDPLVPPQRAHPPWWMATIVGADKRLILGKDPQLGLQGQEMKRRIIAISLLATVLLGCAKTSVSQDDVSDSAPSVAEAPATPEASRSVEDGVDPSVWDNEGEPAADESQHPADEISCEQQPLATYFFTLVGGNSVDGCGRKDAKLLAAFDALMKQAAAVESPDPDVPPLRERLLSGPSAPGRPLQLQGETWWYYSACQAHQCNTTALAMLYSPARSKMVGRLIAKCDVWWLGEPDAAQQALIEATNPLDTSLLRIG